MSERRSSTPLAASSDSAGTAREVRRPPTRASSAALAPGPRTAPARANALASLESEERRVSSRDASGRAGTSPARSKRPPRRVSAPRSTASRSDSESQSADEGPPATRAPSSVPSRTAASPKVAVKSAWAASGESSERLMFSTPNASTGGVTPPGRVASSTRHVAPARRASSSATTSSVCSRSLAQWRSSIASTPLAHAKRAAMRRPRMARRRCSARAGSRGTTTRSRGLRSSGSARASSMRSSSGRAAAVAVSRTARASATRRPSPVRGACTSIHCCPRSCTRCRASRKRRDFPEPASPSTTSARRNTGAPALASTRPSSRSRPTSGADATWLRSVSVVSTSTCRWWMRARSVSTSAALRGRSSGSFAKRRATSAAMGIGTEPGRDGGGSATCACRISDEVPRKGTRPVRSW